MPDANAICATASDRPSVPRTASILRFATSRAANAKSRVPAALPTGEFLVESEFAEGQFFLAIEHPCAQREQIVAGVLR